MASNTPNYNINYDDERFQEVEADKQQALGEVDATYDEMINQSDSFYDTMIQNSKDWADKQSQIQQENTDFAIEKIEQQKDQAQKDYTKEQSGAYVDWQKQSGQYGAKAEQMASQGMTGTGYSESSQVGMYNTYQNRVAVARDALTRANLNYDNAIKDAILQNNSALAEIAFTALQKQAEYALEGFQYKNSLVIEQMNKKQETEDRYYQRWQNVLAQMNEENALAEQVRQHTENIALEKQQLEESKRQFNKEYDLKLKEFKEQKRQFNEEIKRLKAQDKKENEYKIKQLELQKKELKLQEDKLKEDKRQFDKSYELQKKTLSSKSSSISKTSSGGSAKTSKSSSQKTSTVNKTSKVNKAPSIAETKEKQLAQRDKNVPNSAGNNASTMKKKDYYFSNGYQPQYVNNKKLSKTGDTIGSALSGMGLPTKQNVWTNGSGYYVWDGASKSYVDVTAQYKQYRASIYSKYSKFQ